MDQNKLEEIKKHFINLKQAHNWCLKNFPDALGLSGERNDQLEQFLENKVLPAVEVEYRKLAELGVSIELSTAIFLFGGLITDRLMTETIKTST